MSITVHSKDKRARFFIEGSAKNLAVSFQRGSYDDNIRIGIDDIDSVVEAIKSEGLKAKRLSELERRHVAERAALVDLLRGKTMENT
jgi:hypothetical protein